MNKTYCELTQDGTQGEKRYSIHISEVELGLIADLLDSVNDLRAVTLRRAVTSTIRSNNVFVLEQLMKIVKCKKCNRTGSMKHHDEFRQEIKKHECPDCRGEGQRVAIVSKRYEPLSPYWKDKLAKEY